MTRLLISLVAIQSAMVIVLQYRQHASYGTFGFDAGIYDQATWLLAHRPFSGPFLSSRGLPLWGHHVNVILLPLAQLSRVGAGVMFFASLQTVSIYCGALPVSWLARARTGSSLAGLTLGVAYLLYPAHLFFAQTFFHPELLAITPLLALGWSSHQRRYRRVWISALLAMACREEVAVVVCAFAACEIVRAVLRKDRRGVIQSLGLLVVAVSWFVVATKVIIPHALGGEPYYLNTFYGAYGNSYREIATNLVTHPAPFRAVLEDADRRLFLFDLLSPLAFLPLFGASIVITIAPLAGLLLSATPSAYSLQSHYAAMVVPGIFLASASGLGRLWRRFGAAILVPLTICAVISATLRSPAPWGLQYGSWKTTEPKRHAFDRAVALIPEHDAVSAAGNIMPRLSHRRIVYQFPNPFSRWFYGESAIDDLAGLSAPPAQYVGQVDWVVVDRSALGEFRGELDRVIADGTFEIVFDEQDVVVARRVAGGNP